MKEIAFKSIVLSVFFLGYLSLSMAQNESELDIELMKRAYELVEEAIVIDAHAHAADLKEFTGQMSPAGNSQLTLDYMKKGKVDGVGLFFAYYPIEGKSLVSKVKEDLSLLKDLINTNLPDVRIIESDEEMCLVRNNETFIIPGVEYFFGIFNDDVNTVDSLYEMGIRMVTLMDNEKDVLGKRHSENKNKYELSQFGKQIIQRMNHLGMLIDISHLGDPMQRNVIRYSSAPVIASHSPVRSVHEVERNIPDDILKALSDKGGAIMITFNSGALAGIENGRAPIDKLIDHIDHAVKVAGIDHVGIGSDFNGSGRRSPKGLKDASGFPLIAYHLLKRGYSDVDVEKIMGGNALKVLSN